MGQSIIYSNGCDIELINSEVSSNNDSEEVIFFIDSYVLINTSIISNNNSAQNLIKSQNTELSINHSLISNNQNNWRTFLSTAWGASDYTNLSLNNVTVAGNTSETLISFDAFYGEITRRILLFIIIQEKLE